MSSFRSELDLMPDVHPLAYHVTRQLGADHYVIRDPFAAAIDGMASLERAIEIATGLVRKRSAGRSDGARRQGGGGAAGVAVVSDEAAAVHCADRLVVEA